MGTSVGTDGTDGADEAARLSPEELGRVLERVHEGQASLTVAPAPAIYKPPEDPMGWLQRDALGWLMIVLPLLLLAQLVALWPSVHAATTSRTPQPSTPLLLGIAHVRLTPDDALLLLVMFVGALASLAEVSFRFTTNSGRGQLSKRWTWAYLLRPVQGATLATIVYFALRGGLLGVSTSAGAINPYGIAAIAGLVGLFTRQAFQKLKEVFNMLWNVKDPDDDVEAVPQKAPVKGTNGAGAPGA